VATLLAIWRDSGLRTSRRWRAARGLHRAGRWWTPRCPRDCSWCSVNNRLVIRWSTCLLRLRQSVRVRHRREPLHRRRMCRKGRLRGRRRRVSSAAASSLGAACNGRVRQRCAADLDHGGGAAWARRSRAQLARLPRGRADRHLVQPRRRGRGGRGGGLSPSARPRRRPSRWVRGGRGCDPPRGGGDSVKPVHGRRARPRKRAPPAGRCRLQLRALVQRVAAKGAGPNGRARDARGVVPAPPLPGLSP
jgi:hypothetical protein